MPKFDLYGTLTIPVHWQIEADSKEAALEKADAEWTDLQDFVGNGATSGRLIGHQVEGLTIEAGGDQPEWNEVQESCDATG